MFNRALKLPRHPKESLFLWGPRQVGKTTLLNQMYPQAYRLDLLKSEEYRIYTETPERLREELNRRTETVVVIDEVQKVPALLDEVHWLIENRRINFILCGSSARKLKSGHANLLGGRALRFELQGLVSEELGKTFNLSRLLNHGYLPRIYEHENPQDLLSAYVADYLKEEVAAEGLVRRLPAFSNFLSVAALADGASLNYSTIARDCGVSSPTIQGYFEILEDTLLGRKLESYRRRPKRRLQTSPKFYFSDVGTVNFLAKRGRLEPGSELFGKAFENWVHHEITTYNLYRRKHADLSFWRLTTGAEVDFIVNQMDVAIEAKASRKINDDHLRGLRNLVEDYSVGKRYVVCLEAKERQTQDGIVVLPAATFAAQLWQGEIF